MVVIWERDEDTKKSQDIDQACERATIFQVLESWNHDDEGKYRKVVILNAPLSLVVRIYFHTT